MTEKQWGKEYQRYLKGRFNMLWHEDRAYGKICENRHNKDFERLSEEFGAGKAAKASFVYNLFHGKNSFDYLPFKEKKKLVEKTK